MIWYLYVQMKPLALEWFLNKHVIKEANVFIYFILFKHFITIT